MSEEECKTKEELNNNNSINQKEINILLKSKRKNKNKHKDFSQIITISKNLEEKDIIYNYGKYKIFNYDKNGDPLFLIGPDYAYFFFLLILNLIYFIFLCGLFIFLSSFIICCLGIILNIIQFILFIICGIKNPGLPKREMQNENLLIKNPNRYQRCPNCNFIIDKSKHFIHCNTCGCCCEGYDHHCPWTSKCIGKGNIFYFNGTLGMVCVIFVYFVIAVILSEPTKKK